MLPPEISQFFIPLRGPQPADSVLYYEPVLLGSAKVYFSDAKAKVDAERAVCRLARITDDALAVNWQEAQTLEFDESDLEREPSAEADLRLLAVRSQQS